MAKYEIDVGEEFPLGARLALILAGKAHRHHHAHRWHRARHGACGRYWRRDVFDEDFL